VTFSPDGRRIASGGGDRTVRVWDAATGQEALTLLGHAGGVALRGLTSGVSSVAFSRDGRRIASAGVDGTVRVWDAATGQEALTLRGHPGGVTSVAFSPDGRRIASGGDQSDPTVRVWDGTPVTPAWLEECQDLADRRWEVWQRREAGDCERQGQWFAAAWHLDRLLARTPDDADLRNRRDAARARLEEEEHQRQTQTQTLELPADVFAK
jgi:dipeptidyl aminopeptidase/acylaminoacyl peptidase